MFKIFTCSRNGLCLFLSSGCCELNGFTGWSFSSWMPRILSRWTKFIRAEQLKSGNSFSIIANSVRFRQDRSFYDFKSYFSLHLCSYKIWILINWSHMFNRIVFSCFTIKASNFWLGSTWWVSSFKSTCCFDN